MDSGIINLRVLEGVFDVIFDRFKKFDKVSLNLFNMFFLVGNIVR